MIEITLEEVYKVFNAYKEDIAFQLYWENISGVSGAELKDIPFYMWCEIYKNRYNYKIV